MESTLKRNDPATTSLDPDQARRWLEVLGAPRPKKLQAQLDELAPRRLRAPVLQLCASLGLPSALAPTPARSPRLESRGNLQRWLIERAGLELSEEGPLTLVELLIVGIERRFRGRAVELSGELEHLLLLRRADQELWSSQSAELDELRAILHDAAREGPPEPRPPEVLMKPRFRGGRCFAAGLFSLGVSGLAALWPALRWRQGLAELELGPRPETALLLRSYGASPQNLRAALASENPWLRTNALLSLDPARDIASIRSYLGDPAGLVRLTALRIGLRSEDNETLRRALQSPFPELREESLRALRENPNGFASELEAWRARSASDGLSRVQVLRSKAQVAAAELQSELDRELPGLSDPAEVLAWIHLMNGREAWTTRLKAAMVQKLSGLEASVDENLALARWRERLNAELHARGE